MRHTQSCKPVKITETTRPKAHQHHISFSSSCDYRVWPERRGLPGSREVSLFSINTSLWTLPATAGAVVFIMAAFVSPSQAVAGRRLERERPHGRSAVCRGHKERPERESWLCLKRAMPASSCVFYWSQMSVVWIGTSSAVSVCESVSVCALVKASGMQFSHPESIQIRYSLHFIGGGKRDMSPFTGVTGHTLLSRHVCNSSRVVWKCGLFIFLVYLFFCLKYS